MILWGVKEFEEDKKMSGNGNGEDVLVAGDEGKRESSCLPSGNNDNDNEKGGDGGDEEEAPILSAEREVGRGEEREADADTVGISGGEDGDAGHTEESKVMGVVVEKDLPADEEANLKENETWVLKKRQEYMYSNIYFFACRDITCFQYWVNEVRWVMPGFFRKLCQLWDF